MKKFTFANIIALLLLVISITIHFVILGWPLPHIFWTGFIVGVMSLQAMYSILVIYTSIFNE